MLKKSQIGKFARSGKDRGDSRPVQVPKRDNVRTALLARVLRCASVPRAPCVHSVWLGLSCARHNAAPNLCQLRRALLVRKPPTTMPTTSSCNAWRVRGRPGRSSRHLRVRRRAPKPPTTLMWSVWTMLACASHPTRCQQVGRRSRLRRPVCNTWADSTSRSSRMRGKTARQHPRWFKPRGPSRATRSSETPSPTRSVRLCSDCAPIVLRLPSDCPPIALRLRSDVL